MTLRRLLLAGFALCCGSVAHAENWQLAKDEAGIQVYLSDVPGSEYKAYRGVVSFKADLAQLQKDILESCRWTYECQEQKLLKQEGNKVWSYSRYAAPWPVTPRDSIIESTMITEPDGRFTRQLHGVPGYLPEQAGYVRVSSLEGYWSLTPKPDGMVEVVYQVHTNPGGSVPSWLSNKFVVDAPFNTLKQLRATAQQ
jgi:hypothetical protein